MADKTWHQEAQRLFHGYVQDVHDNASRASRVLQAIWPAYDDDDLESGIADAISDLRHLCDLMGLSYPELDRRAYRGYATEVHEFGVADHAELKRAIERDLC